MKEFEIKIAEFIANKNTKTRSGVKFEVVGFQKDGNGNVSTLIGTVTEKNEAGEEKPVEMLWNPTGSALCNIPLKYDLVTELPIAELGK